VVLAAAAAAAGCLSADTLIKVTSSGSGTIEQTVMMNANAIDMLAGMSAMGGEAGKSGSADMFSEKSMREAASRMGEGVRYVSSQPVEANGMKGVKALYAFDDITKLKVSESPDVQAMSGTPGAGSRAERQISFQFAKKGGASLLTVNLPQAAKPDTSKPAQKPESVPPEASAMVDMMKAMMKGLRVAVNVQVDGAITSTNAKYRTGSRVTLLEVDFDQLMQDEAAMRALQGNLRPGASPADLQAAFADLKGVEMGGPTVTIEWK
jgi:hypothetical protein